MRVFRYLLQCRWCTVDTHSRNLYLNECQSCPRMPAAVFAAYILFGAVLWIGSLLMYSYGAAAAVFSIAIDFYQVIGVFGLIRVRAKFQSCCCPCAVIVCVAASLLQSNWPDNVLHLFRYASVLSFNIDSVPLQCTFPQADYIVRWYITQSLPIALLVVCLGLGVVKSCFRYCSWRSTRSLTRFAFKGRSHVRFTNVFLGGLNLLYIYLLQKALEVFKVRVAGSNSACALVWCSLRQQGVGDACVLACVGACSATNQAPTCS